MSLDSGAAPGLRGERVLLRAPRIGDADVLYDLDAGEIGRQATRTGGW